MSASSIRTRCGICSSGRDGTTNCLRCASGCGACNAMPRSGSERSRRSNYAMKITRGNCRCRISSSGSGSLDGGVDMNGQCDELGKRFSGRKVMAATNEGPPNGLGQALRMLWAIYCFPGRLLAEYWYLWSKKGQVWQSGRRRRHPFVHFFYSTVIFAFAYLAISLFSAVGTSRFPDDEDRPSPTVREPDGGAELSTVETPSADTIPGPELDHAIAAQPDGLLTAPIISEPHDDQIGEAMDEAFSTGLPVRIDAEGIAGYAVPSDMESTTGCRSVAFSVDGESHPARTKTYCP